MGVQLLQFPCECMDFHENFCTMQLTIVYSVFSVEVYSPCSYPSTSNFDCLKYCAIA